ncbi:CBO0543 family protein [Bacillus piscicola]|uniref:CBO0543 family protein n=1 Tax=Bacillus piscicola TaxID=1632684 RepID=UPI001F08BA36|nr:CBO0543 family protein [Bacillus piscicola]
MIFITYFIQYQAIDTKIKTPLDIDCIQIKQKSSWRNSTLVKQWIFSSNSGKITLNKGTNPDEFLLGKFCGHEIHVFKEFLTLEKKLLILLTAFCVAGLPLIFRGPKMRENLVIFFSKGVLSTFLDAYVVGTKRVAYPERPFKKLFKTNIIYDLLFFPLLSVLWVKITYNDNFLYIILKSLIFSIPMSLGQWFFEKNTRLFKWRRWSPFHTFASVSFTLFTIRGLIAFIKRLDEYKNSNYLY